MNFRQFAFNNVRRNTRAYSAYFLSSSFAVMIFFMYAVFIFHPDIAKSVGGQEILYGMKTGEYVVLVFSFFFILYSTSSFLKVRSKELGILTILGMQKKQLHRLIFTENMIIGSASILTGMISGIFLSKLFLLMGAKVVDIKELPLYLPMKAIGLTIVSFLPLFIIISLVSLFLIRKKRALELLEGTSKPKTEPKVSILLTFLSLACFTCSTLYIVMKSKSFIESDILQVAGLVCIGTYFFFHQLSGIGIRLLKRSRVFTWKGTRLLWTSEMAYKIKDNSRMFFMITVMMTGACIFVSGFIAQDQELKEEFMKSNPDVIYQTPFGTPPESEHYEKRKWYTDVVRIEKEFKNSGVTFDKVVTSSFPMVDFIEQSVALDVKSQSSYNLGAVNKVSLKQNEAIMIHVPGKNTQEDSGKIIQKLSLPQKDIYLNVVEHLGKGYPNEVIVSDSLYNELRKNGISQYGKTVGETITVKYSIPDWKAKSNLSFGEPVEIQLAKEFHSWETSEGQKTESFEGYITSRAQSYLFNKSSNSAKMFIMVFIAAIFSIASASFIYFKLYTELRQDQRMYHSLSKIGVNSKEMKHSATIQIATLFFLPFFIAALETIIGLLLMKEQMELQNVFIPSLMGTGAFFIAQLIFFIIVRYRYVQQLKRVMV
ncbi:putative ABC transport system permease protein [Croceifilum oryzae]|uniref:ABC transport system permease protein n=1 Tax=Croceifilum oryzae TaxID=1553429 RepID=A0AAJ1WSP6_9BACL|nr:ABC transporter permease [Croceifilum oryzae]MDQ0417193.1 putative ABC transport system permease protein [Croceifilum oryzae]